MSEYWLDNLVSTAAVRSLLAAALRNEDPNPVHMRAADLFLRAMTNLSDAQYAITAAAVDGAPASVQALLDVDDSEHVGVPVMRMQLQPAVDALHRVVSMTDDMMGRLSTETIEKLEELVRPLVKGMLDAFRRGDASRFDVTRRVGLHEHDKG